MMERRDGGTASKDAAAAVGLHVTVTHTSSLHIAIVLASYLFFQSYLFILFYNTIQYNKIIYNAHKVEKSNLRRGQSLDGRRCGRCLARKRC